MDAASHVFVGMLLVSAIAGLFLTCVIMIIADVLKRSRKILATGGLYEGQEVMFYYHHTERPGPGGLKGLHWEPGVIVDRYPDQNLVWVLPKDGPERLICKRENIRTLEEHALHCMAI